MDKEHEINIYENNPELYNNEILSSDIIFTLDFNALHRTGHDMGDFLKHSDALKIMIDHHQAPDDYAKYMYSDVTMSSTCEGKRIGIIDPALAASSKSSSFCLASCRALTSPDIANSH